VFLQTEDGAMLMQSREYDRIVNTRMTMDDLIKLSGASSARATSDRSEGVDPR
jgi:hypothetical protein